MGDSPAQNLPIVSKRSELHSIGAGCGYPDFSRGDTSPEPGTVDPDWLAATLAALADTHQVPGAQLAVHHCGVTVAAEVGELQHATGIPVVRDTAFPIGSISKAYTATLAMILVADGDIELDAPLGDYLPELDDLGEDLTLGQLLSHTSGFASSPDTLALSTVSLGRYVREHCRQQDLILRPGTGFSYSTRNYVLVGHLIETITRMSWWEAMESVLLQPLGTDPAAVVGMRGAPSGRPIATGHSVNTAVGRTRPVPQSLIRAEAPAGALATSAVDLVALGLMHVGSGFPELLPTTYAELMRQPIPEAEPFGLADGWGAGLAVFQDGTIDWFGHDGNADGTSCYLRINPVSGWVVALTTNSNTGSYLWDELHTELGPVNLPIGAYRRDISMRPQVAPPADCVGTYSNGPTEYLIKMGAEGDVYLAKGDELIARMACYDDLVFALQDLVSGQALHVGRFLRDPITGQIEQLQIGGRLARRDFGPAVPEARLPAEALSRQSA
jgi:CubicO group peptidase (beta-lactamase class C family)